MYNYHNPGDDMFQKSPILTHYLHIQSTNLTGKISHWYFRSFTVDSEQATLWLQEVLDIS